MLTTHFATHRYEAFLVADLANIRKLTGFTGTNALVFATPQQAYFLTDSRYTEQAKKEVRGATVVLSDRSLSEEIAHLVRRHKVKKLGFEAAFISVARAKQLKKIVAPAKLVPWMEPQARLRILKETKEITALKKAASINALAFQDILPLLRPGVTELAIRHALETALFKHGAEKLAFDTIIASGRRGAMPHGVASSKKIKKGELVTIDFGGVYKGYHADETCTVAIGEPSARAQKVYATVYAAQQKAAALAAPKITGSALDYTAREHISKAGYGQYFGHALGHGVGLEVHEWPVLSALSQDTLAKNMVFTIEPGIYIPGWGGVRIEDMYVCTAQGVERLTKIKKDTLLTV